MIVKITWEDCCKEDDYMSEEGIKHLVPLKRYNIGEEVYEGETFITLASGITENMFKGQIGYSEISCIPKGCIIKREVYDDGRKGWREL